MKKILFIIIFLLSTIVMTGCSLSENNERVLSDEAWLEDIEMLDKSLREEHSNMFKYLSEEEWEKSIENLKEDISELSDRDIILRMSQIITMIGDAHTGMHPTDLIKPVGEEINLEDMKSGDMNLEGIVEFPVKVEYFDDGVRVIECDSKYKEILGAKLVSINNIEINTILNDVATLFLHDYKNKQCSLYFAKELLNVYDILKFFEVVDSDKAEFVFEKDNKEKITLKLKAVENKKIDYVSENNKDMKTNKVPEGENELYWYENFEEDNILYFRLNKFTSNHVVFKTKEEEEKYPDIDEVEEGLLKEIKEGNYDKLVIDLRYNQGGSVDVRNSIVEMIKFRTDLKGEDIYILTGKASASASVTFAWELQKRLGANVVGEITGSNVNLFSGGQITQLPNSKIYLAISGIERINEKGYIGGVVPDYEAIQTYKDYINGIDTCYEFIKNIDKDK